MIRSLRAFTGILLSCAACGTEPDPPAITTISLSPLSAQIETGASVTLVATILDQRSAPYVGGALVWSSANPAVATVVGGSVVGVAPGTTTIVASANGKQGAATIVVVPIPVAAVTIVNRPSVLFVGATASLTAVITDRTGSPLTGRPVEWSSSAPTVATVDAAGVLRAVAPGTANITATSEGISGIAPVLVLMPGAPPVVSSVSTETLVPGSSVTIAGTGFDTTAAGNAVTVRGVRATVTGASPTLVSFLVPCIGSGNAPIVVTTSVGASEPLSRPVVVTQRSIAVGQSLVLSGGQWQCNEIASTGAAARYLVAVFSAATSANTLVDFELSGNTPAPAALVPRIASRRALSAPPETAEGIADRRHLEMLELNRQWYEQLRAKSASMPPQQRRSSRNELPSVGDMRSLFFTYTAGCNDTTRVMRGKAIYVGSRSIIWEDSSNVLQSGADSALAGYYQRLGRIFDDDQYEAIRSTFGDPLRRDAVTDADGRIHMVFTQRVNGSGAAAFVTSCDQFPTTTSRGSNFGQFFYGSVPTTSTPNLNSTASPDGWFYFIGRTIVHEVKHIASHSARVANGAPTYEQSWLEEGTARHAEEIWVRSALHRVPWKGNTGYGTARDNGLYCDFHPENATCTAADPLRRPSYGMRRQFNELREKLLAPWNWSPYGDGTGQSGSVFYQTVWSLVRYAIDRYGGSDAQFLTALNSSLTNGVTNLSSVTGVPMDQLIGQWSLALYTDDYPGLAANADLQLPTWNFRNIYAGLNADPSWSTRWPQPFPIQPITLGFGSFVTSQIGMRGGAAAYFLMSGTPSGSQLLSLRGANGGPPSASLRLAIVRLP